MPQRNADVWCFLNRILIGSIIIIRDIQRRSLQNILFIKKSFEWRFISVSIFTSRMGYTEILSIFSLLIYQICCQLGVGILVTVLNELRSNFGRIFGKWFMVISQNKVGCFYFIYFFHPFFFRYVFKVFLFGFLFLIQNFFVLTMN